MGYIFEVHEQTVWECSIGASDLFIAQVRAIEHLIKVESCVSDVWADTVEIDPIKFNLFTQSIFTYINRTKHRQLLMMIAGCTKIIVALNAQINGVWPEVNEQYEVWLTEAKTIRL